METIMRAVAAAERGIHGTAATTQQPSFGYEPTATPLSGSATTTSTHGSLSELQLAALMELGFHAQQVLPLCDGVTPVEELVDVLIASGGTVPDAFDTAASDPAGTVVGVPVDYPGSYAGEYDPFGSTGGPTHGGVRPTQRRFRRFGFGASRR